ncbi:CAP domain-containing protein [Nocardiopsis quinghaiensis]|uniref:CAP domain-containing protein n=1 Tax=Nocardiopsis quinghaiensis TaxID=464995 RepID=UPI00123B4482|nr:CAP domain-containing protein [Nocardiopsis quinghaiensis]
MARGRRGRRRTSARGHRSDRRTGRRRVPLAVSLAAVPVGLVLAATLLATGTGEELNPFRNTADGQAAGQVGEAATDDSFVPEASEEDDFFAAPSTSPERNPAPSGDSEPQSADVTASSIPQDSDDQETEGDQADASDDGAGGSGGNGGGGGNGSGGGNGGGGGGGGGVSAGSAVGRVVTLVNNERAEAGCGPLSVDSQLTAAAQEHSEDMDRRDYMSHENPEGEGPGDRARRHGYDAWGAENVAKGQTSPEQVMDAWMNSEGHRRNILNCGLVSIGVGESGNAWTQKFGWE